MLLRVFLRLIDSLSTLEFAALFERRRKYDMSIRISRYPELNKYITDVLASGCGFFRRVRYN